MSAQQGIVLKLVDDATGATIDGRILQDLSDLAPAPHHLQIRTSIGVDTFNKVNIPAYINVFKLLQAHGFELPWIVIQGGLEEGYHQYSGAAYQANMPNARMGYQGNGLLNPYIDLLTQKVIGLVDAFFAAGVLPKYWFIWNEGNEDSDSLQVGQVPQKPMALSAEVFGAMLIHMTRAVSFACPDAFKQVVMIPGSLSCLAKFNTDPAGPWVGGYLNDALAFVKTAYGYQAPYLFSSLCLNLEGILTDDYCRGCAQQLGVVMRKNGITGGTIIGEWGEQNQYTTSENMLPTFQGLTKHFSNVFFYNYDTLNPKLYGLRTVGIDPTGCLYPKDKTAFYEPFRAMLAAYNTPTPCPTITPNA